MKKQAPAELPRIAWFLENLSQGYDTIAYGTTKKEAIAEHNVKHPDTIGNTFKVSKLK